jgi:hypothetical protein
MPHLIYPPDRIDDEEPYADMNYITLLEENGKYRASMKVNGIETEAIEPFDYDDEDGQIQEFNWNTELESWFLKINHRTKEWNFWGERYPSKTDSSTCEELFTNNYAVRFNNQVFFQPYE